MLGSQGLDLSAPAPVNSYDCLLGKPAWSRTPFVKLRWMHAAVLSIVNSHGRRVSIPHEWICSRSPLAPMRLIYGFAVIPPLRAGHSD